MRIVVGAVSERRTTHNVLAEAPRGDARRIVMAGGHIDSVAEGPGLNDNGSGVAALLNLAEDLAARRAAPRARLRFAAGVRRLPARGLAAHRAPAAPRLRRPGPDRRAGYVDLRTLGELHAAVRSALLRLSG